MEEVANRVDDVILLNSCFISWNHLIEASTHAYSFHKPRNTSGLFSRLRFACGKLEYQ